MPAPAQIRKVVVLMMENRSFDHLLFALPRAGAPAPGSNTYNNTAYAQEPLQPQDRLDLYLDPQQARPYFDPKHEFDNVHRQLAHDPNSGEPTMGGFAEDAALTANDELRLTGAAAEPWIRKVMRYVPFGDTPAADPLPAIQGLARQFTVCDRWFASVPGPTWPNRFFAMTGSCHGRMLMPGSWTDGDVAIKGFLAQACRESIFSLLARTGKTSALYSEGETPLAYLVKGSGTRRTLQQFEQDARVDTLPQFSWVEPSYGFVGSPRDSQHPPEDLRHGDALVARVFNAIAASKKTWESTLLVVVWDEHGGFYDHVVPPADAIAPDDFAADVPVGGPPFDFKRLGVRVPAILVSPWIRQGIAPMAGTDWYDHTSLLAFVCDLFGMPRAALGRRVAQARHFGDAAIWSPAPRADAPAGMKLPVVQVAPPAGFLETETDLARDTRKLVQTVHAYLTGGNPVDASHQIAGGARGIDLPGLPSSKLLGALAERSRRLLEAAAPMPPAVPQLGAPPAGAAAPVVAGDGKVRVLCIHGVGHGDGEKGWRADPNWKANWEAVIRPSLQAAGVQGEAIEIDYLAYDDLFGDGPSLAQIARGMGMLLDGLLAVDQQRTRDLQLPDVREVMRWTAGMAIQWIEDEPLREKLRAALLKKIHDTGAKVILAHSLGSLIAYETFRHSLARGGTGLAAIDGLMLATFGSQIAHPVVVREAWGGTLQPLHDAAGRGIARWFHLFNPHDKVFTAPIEIPDVGRSDLLTPFGEPPLVDLFALDHAGERYLAHEATHKAMWPVLARPAQVPAQLTRALVASDRLRMLKGSKRRALLVGINNYPDAAWRLNGCVNDVYLMSRTLQQSGYSAADIRLLVDERATQANLLDRLAWLVEGAGPGDERVFFYSGHGTQIPSYGPGGLPDHVDESLVPYDFDWDEDATHFTDKQFRKFYAHLPFGSSKDDARLVVVFDCCHAGGMTRGAALVRGINPPYDMAHRMVRWDGQEGEWRPRAYADVGRATRAFSDSVKNDVQRGRRAQGTAYGLRPFSKPQLTRLGKALGHRGPYMPLLLYAARQAELASEYENGSTSYGAFTFSLVEQLRRTQQSLLSYDALLAATAQALERKGFGQHPELVGPKDARGAMCHWR